MTKLHRNPPARESNPCRLTVTREEVAQGQVTCSEHGIRPCGGKRGEEWLPPRTSLAGPGRSRPGPRLPSCRAQCRRVSLQSFWGATPLDSLWWCRANADASDMGQPAELLGASMSSPVNQRGPYQRLPHRDRRPEHLPSRLIPAASHWPLNTSRLHAGTFSAHSDSVMSVSFRPSSG